MEVITFFTHYAYSTLDDSILLTLICTVLYLALHFLLTPSFYLPLHLTPSAPPPRPLNPLGSRCEIQLTITWIRTHLEMNSEVSLPKREVYNEYM